MIYGYPVYNIFDQQYIEEQWMQQHHNNQMMKTYECVRKFEDFLNSVDDVEPNYQQQLLGEICLVYMQHIKMRNT